MLGFSEEEKIEIGLRIRAARSKAGLSQAQLGVAIGYSEVSAKASISTVEHGRSESMPALAAIARALSISLDYLVFGKENGGPENGGPSQETAIIYLTDLVQRYLDLLKKFAADPAAAEEFARSAHSEIAALHLLQEQDPGREEG